jgi:cysteine-S-conjugate beta-lyase
MKYDFDEVIPRSGTRSFKWDFRKQDGKVVQWDGTDPMHGKAQTLPMWVADMDFRCPKPIVDAVTERARQGIYGYTYPDKSLYESITKWFRRRHNWEISDDWIRIVPAGTVPGIHTMVQAFTQPGDKVLIQQPVYYPFSAAIENNGAEIVNNPLIYDNGRYRMDYDDLALKASDPNVKLAILCSPHNPVGRVWTREELKRFADICLDNDVLMIADEIHCDLTFKDVHFTPLATISDEIAERTIVCHAPSKTFNLAGLQTSNLVIPGDAAREKFDEALDVNGLFGLNPLSAVALEAAFNHGEPWLAQMMDYVEGNYNFMVSFFEEHLPQLPIIQPEATYLIWFDCRSLKLDNLALEELMFERAGVYLDEGCIFGPEGDGFERINIACPRSILEDAMVRMKDSIAQLGV